MYNDLPFADLAKQNINLSSKVLGAFKDCETGIN